MEKVVSHSLSLTNIDFIMMLVSANITLIICALAKPQAMPQMIFYNFYRIFETWVFLIFSQIFIFELSSIEKIKGKIETMKAFMTGNKNLVKKGVIVPCIINNYNHI